MIIKITEKCLVSYVEEENVVDTEDKGVISFRHFYYETDKKSFSEAVKEIIDDFDVEKAFGENEDVEYDGEYLNSLGYVGFVLCENEK